MLQTLFEQIGKDNIVSIVTEFYKRAFEDGIIGHFFFNKNREELTAKQIAFTSVLLGSKSDAYHGKPLSKAHQDLAISVPHFNRRLMILSEVIDEHEIPSQLRDQWIQKEKMLLSAVITSR